MKLDKKTGKWKRKSEALRLFNETFRCARIGKKPLSRPTLDKLIKLYPTGIVEKPKKLKKKFEEDFEKCDSWASLRNWAFWKQRKGFILQAFQILGKQCPETWTLEDVKKLREDPTITIGEVTRENTLMIPVTKMIAPEAAMAIRTMLYRIGNYDAIKALKDVEKRPKGARKEWYLENQQIIQLIENTDLPDMLVFIALELQCGGRPTPTINLRVNKLRFLTVEDDDGNKFRILNIPMYEPKKKVKVNRYFSVETANLLKRYITDMQLKPEDRLFPNLRNTIEATKILKKTAEKIGLELAEGREIGTYILRHTYATQASEHDVSSEVIMAMGGWTTWEVVTDFYLHIRKEKVLKEQLGLKMKTLNFGEWIKQFVPVWEKRYEQIRLKMGKEA